MSELEQLQRKDKWTAEDRKRYSELTRTEKSNAVYEPLSETPPLWRQMDKVHEKFVGKIEPWTEMKCTTCQSKYHLIDLASCECGIEESKKRYAKYIGEKDGFKKACR